MNKYTEAIDAIFNKYGKPEDEYILLGCCHTDYDLGELDYFGTSSVLEKLEGFNDSESTVVDPYPYGNDEDKEAMKLNEEFEAELNKFLPMMYNSFPKFFKSDYEGTNEYWYRCYFVTRDHKLFQMMTSSWDPEDGDREQEIDLDKLSDEKVNDDADNANLEEIAEHVRIIKLLVKGLKTEKGREKAKKKIQTLIGKEKT